MDINFVLEEINLLASGFGLIFFLCFLLWYQEKETQRTENQVVDDNSYDVNEREGLESPVLRSLSCYQYVVHTATSAPESVDSWREQCVVCLMEFKEREWCRALPSCNHTFHLECIDGWFKSHSTCPLCRDNVGPVRVELGSSEESILVEIVLGY